MPWIIPLLKEKKQLYYVWPGSVSDYILLAGQFESLGIGVNITSMMFIIGSVK